ncbi:hypothetical protein S245_058344 [Arachis hypogaea]
MAEMPMDKNEISITSQGRLGSNQIIHRRTHKLDPVTSLVTRSGYGGFVQDNILEVPYFDYSCSCTLVLSTCRGLWIFNRYRSPLPVD